MGLILAATQNRSSPSYSYSYSVAAHRTSLNRGKGTAKSLGCASAPRLSSVGDAVAGTDLTVPAASMSVAAGLIAR
jgi:hypothetical protein